MGFFQRITTEYGMNCTRQLKLWSTLNTKLAALYNRRIFLLQCRQQGLIPSHISNQTKGIGPNIDIYEGRTGQDIREFIRSYVYGIVDVVMMMRNKKRRNRGYVFLEFETHQLAYKGKRGLRGHKFWGKELRVEWAEPHHSATISNHKQQKATLLLTNLPVEFTATDAMKYISCLMDINMITAIRKISHYVFLDFLNRSLAENALVSLKDLVIAGRKVKVEWANSAPKRNQKNPLKALEPGQVKTDEETQIEWKLDFGGLETCLIKLFSKE